VNLRDGHVDTEHRDAHDHDVANRDGRILFHSVDDVRFDKKKTRAAVNETRAL
jgi:hypothetical protein